MQEIKAFIRPNMLNAVLQALHEHPDFPGVTVSEVRGFGKVAGRDPSQPSGYG
ncbi:MAG TPA: GlnB, partial [Phycisphaerales bacterium]|nr:GlnB [Phycisphaerales bacterium]